MATAIVAAGEARTVAIEVGMQNGGMAGALAVGVLGSAVAALPANVFSIWEQKGSSMYCVKGESEKALHGSESGY